MNQLQIIELERKLDRVFYDFQIDGQLLSHQLGIGNRLENLAFYSCDLDFMNIDQIRFPQYDRLAVISRAVEAFWGIRKSASQFDNDRIVLYRCHCGCDYCGVISFQLLQDHHNIYWQDIRYEDALDDSTEQEYSIVLPQLVFNKAAYRIVFEEHLQTVRKFKDLF